MNRVRNISVEIRAAQVISALRADQLAMMPSQPLAAVRADLLYMGLDRLRAGMRIR